MTQKNTTVTEGQSLFYFNAFKYLLITAVWVFVVIHAFTMDITHDEAFSFFLVKTNYFRAMCGTANTHWLNSFFMKLFNLVFGNAPGVLRIHSVLSFPFFAFGLFRLSALINNKLTRLVFCSIVLLNPYILDFFSLARGYGMALTFQVWLVIFVIEALGCRAFNYTKWLRVVLLATLMIGANLSYLYSALGVAGIFIVHLIWPFSAGYALKNKQVLNIALLFCLLFFLTAADLLFIKYYGKDLEFGGDTDFVGSLFGSVWEGSLYFSSYRTYLQSTLTCSSLVLLLFSTVYFAVLSFKKREFHKGLIMAFPVIAVLTLNVFFHLLFRTPFLYERTALQWLPLGMLLIFFCSAAPVAKRTINRYIILPIKVLFLAILIFHCLRTTNKYYCFEWRLQAGGNECMQDLSRMHAIHPAVFSWLAGVYINYYRNINQDFAALSPVFIDEDQMQDCPPAELKKISQSGYAVIAYPTTFGCIQKSGISFHVIKLYAHNNFKLIKMDTPQQ